MFKVQISLKQDFDKIHLKKLKTLSYKKVGDVATLIINEEGHDS